MKEKNITLSSIRYNAIKKVQKSQAETPTKTMNPLPLITELLL